MQNKLHIALTTLLMLVLTQKNYAQVPVLGTTENFALFSAIGAFSNVGASVVTGDVGTNVGAFTGFPPGTLIGQIYVADPTTVIAATDVNLLYSGLAATTCGVVIATTIGNGQSLTPNVYCLGAASILNDTLVLDGEQNRNALFIFKINGALSANAFSKVTLINGASACNVYWQINGAFHLGTGAQFAGTVVANGALNLGSGSSLEGRGLTRDGAISVAASTVTVPNCCLLRLKVKKEVCPGDGNGLLTALVNGIGLYNYTWSTGSTTQSISYSTSNVYTVTVTGKGCTGNTMISKRVKALNPIVFIQQRSEPTCASCCNGSVFGGFTKGGTPPYTYLWSDGNTNANRTDFCVGKYQLTITDANGCTALIQKHFGKNLKSGEQEDALAFELLIAPNPGNGIVNLNVETWSSQTLDFKITDLIGKALYQQQLNAEIGESTIPMDFSGLPAGIYFLNLRNGSVSKNIKYVKN